MTDPFTDLPLAPKADRPPRNGLGIAALALGMAAILTAWTPLLLLVGWIVALLAVIFGAIGLAWARTGLATNGGTAAGGFFSGLGALVVAVVVVLLSSGSEIFGGPDPLAVAEETASPSEPATEAAEDLPGFGSGSWETGVDIEPGTYVTSSWGAGICNAFRLSGFGGSEEEVLGELTIPTDARGRITLLESDAGLRVSGDCRWLPAAEAEPYADEDGEFHEGVFEVGTEIPPGTYSTDSPELTGFDGCYVGRLSGFSMALEDVIEYQYIPGGERALIDIADSDAGVHFVGTCGWTLT